eukprot:CAMPEP_0178958186 /NCGR_PEP_ID=MMETSP0789-20121207/11445_1 /TAXON_ID=3005 /ORGANISM="Rhizosolenia setigera, Strain CCMP 1694" /LENGTH=632 /DNA_ID=CAMNT_0020640749 /DNA_START=194 /DNA_END=2088 /DNA_ORIENTATION=-
MKIKKDAVFDSLWDSSIIEEGEENSANNDSDSDDDSQRVFTPVVLDTSSVVAGCYHYSDDDDQSTTMVGNSNRNNASTISPTALDISISSTAAIGIALAGTESTAGDSSEDESIPNEVHYENNYEEGRRTTDRRYRYGRYEDHPRLDHTNDTHKKKKQSARQSGKYKHMNNNYEYNSDRQNRRKKYSKEERERVSRRKEKERRQRRARRRSPKHASNDKPPHTVGTDNRMKSSEKMFNCFVRYKMIMVVLFAFIFVTFIVSVASVVVLIVAPRMKFNSVNDSNINDSSGTYGNSEDTENNNAHNQGIIEDTPEPTTKPTELPTFNPSFYPSFNPSSFPSNIPSQYPSIHPSLHPTHPPTSFPTHKPTISIMPSHSPTKYPTQEPTIHPTSAPTGVFVNFFIMGDIPYDKKEARNLERTFQTMPNYASFIIHVGDINRAKKGCPLENYENVRRIFLQAPLPFFLIPGDNDWNDCSNTTEAWSFWTGNFDQLHRNWSHDLPVTHQTNRTENFAFFLEDFVLFIGLNIVGGTRHDEVEWETRLDSQLKWTEQLIDSYMDRGLTTVVVFGHAMPRVIHRTFFRGFVKNAKNQYSDLQFLYTHGDGHDWKVETKYEDADNILRVQVDDGNDVPFYQV